MATFVHSPGQGSLLTNHDKVNDKAPDLTGVLVLSKDYAAGDTVRIGAWTKNTPKGVIISMRENNWKPDNTTQYPKETNRRDDEVPF
jgi:hypothetical protein